jgi:RNA polymerase sigma-70 factor (ECF subfamily)
MDQLEEQQIISAILGGDADVYAMLVNRYQQPIFNLTYRMTGSREDAADLAQDAFIKAYEQLYRFQAGKKFFPWLYTIALNHTRNFLRKNKITRTVAIEDCDLHSDSDHAAQEEDKMCARLDCQRLQWALTRLPWEYREAVILRYREELPMEDIATALSLSLSGAKMRVHRGLKKLREILEMNDDGNRNTSSPI